MCAVCCHIDIYDFFFLQERSGNNSFTHDALTLKYKLDNEFELVFVVSLFIYNNISNQNVQGKLSICMAYGIVKVLLAQNNNATFLHLF